MVSYHLGGGGCVGGSARSPSTPTPHHDLARIDGRVVHRAARLSFVRQQAVAAVEEQQPELLTLSRASTAIRQEISVCQLLRIGRYRTSARAMRSAEACTSAIADTQCSPTPGTSNSAARTLAKLPKRSISSL